MIVLVCISKLGSRPASSGVEHPHRRKADIQGHQDREDVAVGLIRKRQHLDQHPEHGQRREHRPRVAVPRRGFLRAPHQHHAERQQQNGERVRLQNVLVAVGDVVVP